MSITTEEAREYLDSPAKELSDEEVAQLVKDAEALARLCLDVYLRAGSINVANNIVK